MQEILFRGKSDGEQPKWVYGYYAREVYDDAVEHSIFDGIHHGPRNRATAVSYEIIPETLGRFSGATDKFGTKIFEGDILLERIRTRSTKTGEPAYKTRRYVVRLGAWSFYLEAVGAKGSPSRCVERCEVIGNIYDNPELLKHGGT